MYIGVDSAIPIDSMNNLLYKLIGFWSSGLIQESKKMQKWQKKGTFDYRLYL